jgi:hypothetical protein
MVLERTGWKLSSTRCANFCRECGVLISRLLVSKSYHIQLIYFSLYHSLDTSSQLRLCELDYFRCPWTGFARTKDGLKFCGEVNVLCYLLYCSKAEKVWLHDY